jgi:hypothetical protein
MALNRGSTLHIAVEWARSLFKHVQVPEDSFTDENQMANSIGAETCTPEIAIGGYAADSRVAAVGEALDHRRESPCEIVSRS